MDIIKIFDNVNLKKTRIFNIPKIIITLFAKIGDVIPILINTNKIDKLTESYIVSNEKIIKVIGKRLPLSTEEGLIQTIIQLSKRK